VTADLGAAFATTARVVVLLVAAIAIWGCEATPSATTSAGPPELQQVSASNPGSQALGVLGLCQIGAGYQVSLDRVVGMAKLTTAADIVHYVPLSGREPQLRDPGPAWVVELRGDIPQPKIAEIWTDPTCVVTTTDSGYFATGLVTKTETGQTFRPQPPGMVPDRVLPPLAP
jgi:hypothetical protein